MCKPIQVGVCLIHGVVGYWSASYLCKQFSTVILKPVLKAEKGGHNEHEQFLFVFSLFEALLRKLKTVTVLLHVTSWPFPLGRKLGSLFLGSSAGSCGQQLLQLWALQLHSDGSGCRGESLSAKTPRIKKQKPKKQPELQLMKGNGLLQSFFPPPLSTEKCKHEWWTAEEEKAGLKSFMWLHLANRIRPYVNEGTLWPGPRVSGRCEKKFISNVVQKHIRWWKWGEGGDGPSSPSCGWRPVSAGSRCKR